MIPKGPSKLKVMRKQKDSRSQGKQIKKVEENKKPNKKDQKGKGKKENFQKGKFYNN